MKDKTIDKGNEFDWGKASEDYAKYRDIYPEEFYKKIIDANLCKKGQRVLDLGTGTGVLPRHLYKYGAEFVGIDSSENQIKQAKLLTSKEEKQIDYLCCPAEQITGWDHEFDVVTACQCFFYFQHDILAKKIHQLLKKDGKLVLLYMAWLPYEDQIAEKSEELILQYNPSWTGCKETRHFISVPQIYHKYFTIEKEEVFDLAVPFTKESWNGRMKACRGIGASLSESKVKEFELAHKALLDKIAPDTFFVLHYAAMTILQAIEL